MSGNSRLLPLSNLSGNWTCWKNNIWIGLIEVLTMILRKPVSAHFYISALHEEFAALGLCSVCYYFIYSFFPLYMYWLCPSRSISPNSAAEFFTKKLLRISDCYFRREVACIFPPCCNWSGVLIFRHNYSSIHRPKKKKKKKKKTLHSHFTRTSAPGVPWVGKKCFSMRIGDLQCRWNSAVTCAVSHRRNVQSHAIKQTLHTVQVLCQQTFNSLNLFSLSLSLSLSLSPKIQINLFSIVSDSKSENNIALISLLYISYLCI